MAEEMKSLRDDLIAAKKLIDTPAKWCKGIAGGRRCTHLALLDARAVYGIDLLAKSLPFWWRIRWYLGSRFSARYVIRFNDAPDTTHDMVMQLFDRAIAAAEAR